MTDPTTKIARGIQSGEGYTTKNTTRTPPRLAALANLRGDLPAIKTQRSAVITAHAALESINTATVRTIKTQTAAIG